MRIYVLGCEDPLFSSVIYERLLRQYQNHIIGFSFPGGLFSYKRILWGPLWYGPLNYLKIVFKVALSKVYGPGPVEKIIRKHGYRLGSFVNPNADEFINFLGRNSVDLIISINCNSILKRKVIQACPLGVINIHNGKLPAYRGLMSIFHAYANGEREIGVTVHYIDEKIDMGQIINQSCIEIEPQDSYLSLWEKAVLLGSDLLLISIDQILNNHVHLLKVDRSSSSYFSFPDFRQTIKYYKRYLRSFFLRKDR